MRAIAIAVAVAAALFIERSAWAVSYDEFSRLKDVVIEMCRGGTLTGSMQRIEASGGFGVIRLGDVIVDDEFADVTLVAEEWQGILALAGDSNRYADCAEYALGVIFPALSAKRNIATDLNARLEYIRSTEFCQRLRYVISQGTGGFTEWRTGAGTSHASGPRWDIGPYVMANSEALGMTDITFEDDVLPEDVLAMRTQFERITRDIDALPEAQKQSPGGQLLQQQHRQLYVELEDLIRITTTGRRDAIVDVDHEFDQITFREPLVLTDRFDVVSETGLILSRVENAIDDCIAEPPFRATKDTRYRRKTTSQSGMPLWEFRRSRFLADSVIDVYVGLYRFDRITDRYSTEIGLNVTNMPD